MKSRRRKKARKTRMARSLRLELLELDLRGEGEIEAIIFAGEREGVEAGPRDDTG